MIHHVWGLFTHPDQEWQEIRGEDESVGHMYLTHVLILAAIPVISAYIGTTQVGWAIGDRAPVMLTEASALQMSIMSYIAMLAGVAVMLSRVVLPQIKLNSWLNLAANGSVAAAIVVAAVIWLLSIFFLGLVLWAKT